MTRLKIAATILDAAEKWKKRCLLEGGSQFMIGVSQLAGPQTVG